MKNFDENDVSIEHAKLIDGSGYYPGKKVSASCCILTRRASEGYCTGTPLARASGSYMSFFCCQGNIFA